MGGPLLLCSLVWGHPVIVINLSVVSLSGVVTSVVLQPVVVHPVVGQPVVVQPEIVKSAWGHSVLVQPVTDLLI